MKKITSWGTRIKKHLADEEKERQKLLGKELQVRMSKIQKLAPPVSWAIPSIDRALEEVFRLRCDLAHNAEFKDVLRKFHEKYYSRTKTNYLSVLLKLVLGDRRVSKMRFKYATALQLAFEEGVKPGKLIAFIRKEGGLNKCVERYSNEYRSRS